MTPLLMAALGLLMVATAFLSGLFGMAGGLILIGVLLTILPLPSAMVLHAITQMASNGWRAFLWRAHIRWKPVFIYLIGAALALGAWSITRYVPDKPIALLLLGVTPFMARLTPKGLKPNPESIAQGSFYGFICMGLMLMTGVSGPLMDTFFLGGNFGRREVVATKAACQVASHFVKLVYFGGIIAAGRHARSGARRDRGGRLDARHHPGKAHSGGHERPAVPHLGGTADHDGRLLLHHLRQLAAAGAVVRKQSARLLTGCDDWSTHGRIASAQIVTTIFPTACRSAMSWMASPPLCSGNSALMPGDRIPSRYQR